MGIMWVPWGLYDSGPPIQKLSQNSGALPSRDTIGVSMGFTALTPTLSQGEREPSCRTTF